MNGKDITRIHDKLDKIDDRTQVMAVDIASLKTWSKVWKFLATSALGGMFAFIWHKLK